MIEETLADKWIEEMQEYGLTPNQMLEVIQIAKEKHKQLKSRNTLLKTEF